MRTVMLPTFFDRAYLINLPERTDRLRSAQRELARLGWPLGPEGVRLFSALRYTDRAGFPSAGTRGCYESHRACLQLAHREGARNVLMIEDDIFFSTNLPRLLPTIISRLERNDWDFFYLGYVPYGGISPLPDTNGLKSKSDLSVNRYDGALITCHCYVINGRTLPRLLAHLDRLRVGLEGDQDAGPMPIDGAYNIFRRDPDVVTLVTDPMLAFQRPSRSDISPKGFDRVPILREVIQTLRECKHAVTTWRL